MSLGGELRGQTYHLPVRVYYEDTDQQGIVFYANYLKYFERGRTELLRHLGAPPADIETRLDRLFVVAKVEITYHKSARLDDLLDVRTRLASLGRAGPRQKLAGNLWKLIRTSWTLLIAGNLLKTG